MVPWAQLFLVLTNLAKLLRFKLPASGLPRTRQSKLGTQDELLDWQVAASISSDQSNQTLKEIGKENPLRRLATIIRFVGRLKYIYKKKPSVLEWPFREY